EASPHQAVELQEAVAPELELQHEACRLVAVPAALAAVLLVPEVAAQFAQARLAPQRKVHEAPLAGGGLDAAGEAGDLAAEPFSQARRQLGALRLAAAGAAQPVREVALVQRGEENQDPRGQPRADLGQGPRDGLGLAGGQALEQ